MRESVLFLFYVSFSIMFVGCDKYLEVSPDNEQVTDQFWNSKEDVESVINSGYYYMRICIPTFIKWGELRGGTLYSNNSTDSQLQDFNMIASNSLCKYADVYKVISVANSVLEYAPKVLDNDDTYNVAVYRGNMAEAYFMRAYCYFILMKNFGEVPLITKPYVNDQQSFDIAKSTEEEIVLQIKKDILDALALGEIRGVYEKEWETKGRVTKWALYALMADVCLWNCDYEECCDYCNLILSPKDTFHPAFLKNTSDWYSMFYPGNSNESIFELNWDYFTDNNNRENNFHTMFTLQNNSRLKPTNRAMDAMRDETRELSDLGYPENTRMGRMLLATYVPSSNDISTWEYSTQFYIWKYYGNENANISGGVRSYQDANFIIFRVAEIILMKAEAYVMMGQSKWNEAVALINQIRNRAGLDDFDVSSCGEWDLLSEILSQREMEFVAEGKRWYDLMRMARIADGKYRSIIEELIVQGNETTNKNWIRSVLFNDNAWYMPLPQSEINSNALLIQNPYYQ